MADYRFPILGPDVPRMLGRTMVMQRLWNDLAKVTPSHLSVVGPRYSGKSVLMNALANRMRCPDSPYKVVVLWDLKHQTPASDDEFLKALCQQLSVGVAAVDEAYSSHLLNAVGDGYGEVREVLDEFKNDGPRVLMLWEGFDKPLAHGRLSRNLWDRLCDLLKHPNLTVVTATRRTLHDLIRSEESASSDFWGAFDVNPIRLGGFDEDDCTAVLSTIVGSLFDPSARKELANWTAMYPPLCLAVLNEVPDADLANVSNTSIARAAQTALTREHVCHILNDIWSDCSEPAKDLFRHLWEKGELLAADAGGNEKACLAERGLLIYAGNKIVKSCRLMTAYLAGNRQDAGSLMRLFASQEQYRANIRGVLELRLAQLRGIDGRLRRFIERAIEDVPDHPRECLVNMRGIADRALDLVWDSEFGAGRVIPRAWFAEWQYNGEKGPENDWREQFPSKRGHQVRLLQLMTGTERTAAKAKRVSKSTYILLSAVQRFGDFGQHLEGVDLQAETAVAAVMSCLELASCLWRELGMEHTGT